MDPVTLTIAGTAVLVSAATVWSHRSRRRWHTVLRRLAQGREWRFVPARLLRPAKVLDSTSQRSLTITTGTTDGESLYSLITVEAPMPGIELICAERFVTQLKKAISGPDVDIGVPDFDDVIELRGDRRLLLARLDVETQALIRVFVKDFGRVADGKLAAKRAGYVKAYDELVEWSDLVLELSKHLAGTPLGDDHQLLENVIHGPTGANRLACFEVIEDEALRMEGAEQLLQDDDHANRLEAAIVLGRPDILAKALATRLGSDTRIRVLEALLACDADIAAESLREHIVSRTNGLPRLVTLAAEWTGRGIHIAPLSEVAHLVEGANVELGMALVYWSSCFGAQAEPVLLDLLQHIDDGVASAAAAALGTIGSLGAVHPLMTRSEGIMRAGHLKSNAREAIAEIQGRQGNGVPGGLALVQKGVGGELELADDEESS